MVLSGSWVIDSNTSFQFWIKNVASIRELPARLKVSVMRASEPAYYPDPPDKYALS
jgi:hypothetical protein